MKPQRIEMQWPAEKLQRALNLVIDEQAFSPLRKRNMKKKLAKQVRHGGLELANLDTEWLHRLCAASLMLHDYHWFAWEWRSQWASELATRDWIWPRWDGSRARVLVLAEQGVGDEIVFASCYHELARDVEEAWIECDPRLIPIFTRSFPENLHFVNRFKDARKRIVPRMSDYPKIREGLPVEAFIMAGNVPKLYRQSPADFPKERYGYLTWDADLYRKWYGWLSDNYPDGTPDFVGCSWIGRQGKIEPLAVGISLQYGVGSHGSLVVPPLDLKWDLEGVFALIAALDGVVTTTNAVAHMAGALGVPTDVIKPPPIYATKEDGFNNRVQAWWPDDRSDWYPSVRMFRSQAEWRARR